MPFGLVSAWNKRRRSKSQDHTDPCMFFTSPTASVSPQYSYITSMSSIFQGYKHVEFWQLEDQTLQHTERHHGSVFTLREMEEATNSFSEENLLSKGGFGRVYRGTLQSGELPPFKEAEGEREFQVEVDILSRLNHPNLVSFIGYCADGKHRFLVYDYMLNGNLEDHLNGIGEAKMDWPTWLKVAFGAAKGLAFLHSSSSVGIPIVHQDFKSTKVLLSTNFEAKTRKLTLQSDVCAFGVVLLELLTGRQAVGLNQGPTDQNLVLQVRHILNDRKKMRKVIDPELS